MNNGPNEPDDSPDYEVAAGTELSQLRRRGLERTPELPPRPFLYTLDQIAALLSIDLHYLKSQYIHYDGRTVGAQHPDFLLARNIAPHGKPTDWRIAEHELARFLKRKGYRLHMRGWVT